MYSSLQHPKGVVRVDWSVQAAIRVARLAVFLAQYIMYGVFIGTMVFLPSFDVVIGGMGLTTVHDGWVGWGTSIGLTGLQSAIWFMITEGRSKEKGELAQRIGFALLALFTVFDTWIDALSIIGVAGGIPGSSVDPDKQQIFWLSFVVLLLFALGGEIVLALITQNLRRFIATRSGSKMSDTELAGLGATRSDTFPSIREPGIVRN